MMTLQALDDEDGRHLPQFLSFRIARLHLALNAQATAVLAKEAEIGLGQWRLLSMIGSGAASTTREVSARTGMDPAFVSRTLRSLETAGLVEAKRSQSDRRQINLELTEAGSVLYAKVLPRMQARQENLLRALEPRERDLVFRIIDKLEIAAEVREFDL